MSHDIIFLIFKASQWIPLCNKKFRYKVAIWFQIKNITSLIRWSSIFMLIEIFGSYFWKEHTIYGGSQSYFNIT
jgi:hypothetical protein